MWKDAEKQHKKYGYLGNTPALTSELDNGLHAYGARNGDDRGKMMAFLSYWRTLEGLQDFGRSDAHMG